MTKFNKTKDALIQLKFATANASSEVVYIQQMFLVVACISATLFCSYCMDLAADNNHMSLYYLILIMGMFVLSIVWINWAVKKLFSNVIKSNKERITELSNRLTGV